MQNLIIIRCKTKKKHFKVLKDETTTESENTEE